MFIAVFKETNVAFSSDFNPPGAANHLGCEMSALRTTLRTFLTETLIVDSVCATDAGLLCDGFIAEI